MQVQVGSATLELVQGDITQQDTDGIVNAANSNLMGGGGVDGAIHRAGGPAILEECRAIVARQGHLPTGQAVITTGGRLPSRHVIHTVGPVWSGGHAAADALLASAYRSSLALAAAHGLSSVAFPSISTGAYRFPLQRAARVALGAALDFLRREPHRLTLVRFVLWDDAALRAYEEALAELAPEAG